MATILENMAKAAYEHFNEAVIGSLEPTWEQLPRDFKERMVEAQRAAVVSLCNLAEDTTDCPGYLDGLWSRKNLEAFAYDVAELRYVETTTSVTEKDILAELDKYDWWGVCPYRSARAVELGRAMLPSKFANAKDYAEALANHVQKEHDCRFD